MANRENKWNTKEYQRIKRQSEMYELQDANSGNYVSWEGLQKVNHYTPENIYEKVAPNIYIKIDPSDKIKKLNLEIVGKQAVIDEYSKYVSDPSWREKELADELSDLKRAYKLRLLDIENLKTDLKNERELKVEDTEKIKTLKEEIVRLNKFIKDKNIQELLNKVDNLEGIVKEQTKDIGFINNLAVELGISVYDIERFQKIGQQIEYIKEVGRKARDEVLELQKYRDDTYNTLGVKDFIELQNKLGTKDGVDFRTLNDLLLNISIWEKLDKDNREFIKNLVEKGRGQTNEIDRWKNDLEKTRQSLQRVETLSGGLLAKKTDWTLEDLKGIKRDEWKVTFFLLPNVYRLVFHLAGSYRAMLKLWMKEHGIKVPKDEDDESWRDWFRKMANYPLVTIRF